MIDSFANALQLVVMVAIGIFTFNFLLVAAAVLRAWRRVVHLRRALDAIAPADPIEPWEVEYAFRKIMAKEPPHRLPVLARRMLRTLDDGAFTMDTLTAARALVAVIEDNRKNGNGSAP